MHQTDRILGHFLPFYPPKWSQKLKLWKNEMSGNIILLHMRTINEDHMIYGSWNIRCNRQNFCHFGPFLPFHPPLTTWKIKILKTWKETKRYHFMHVHYKCQSYDVRFLRYGVQQIEFFAILDHFCPLTSVWAQKIKILEKNKKAWRYNHFTNVYHKWQSSDVWFLKHQQIADEQPTKAEIVHQTANLSLAIPKNVNTTFLTNRGQQVNINLLQQSTSSSKLWQHYENSTGLQSEGNVINLKGCVCYIFASLFFMFKWKHLWNKGKWFLFHFESFFHSWDNQILTF